MPEKMKIAAIICELNPLHQGHQALFSHAKSRCEGLVCVLSGNYVQRGEPAILDKWARTRLALASGADLVLELPLPWAMAGAERFAAGGVALANGLGNVDTLFFGSEEGDAPRLKELAEALLSPGFSGRYERRTQPCPSRCGGSGPRPGWWEWTPPPCSQSPNCILGVEYLKALLVQGSSIKAEAFPRLGAGHDVPEAQGPILSASQARELLARGEPTAGRLPAVTEEVWRQETALGRAPALLSRLEMAVLCKLRTMGPQDFAALPDVSEGLEYRLYQAARQAGSLEELYGRIKSKRYPLARARRLVLAAFLGVKEEGLPKLPSYLWVLGMTEVGQRVLRQASPTLPLASRPGDFQKLGGQALELFQLEARADDLYGLCCPVPQPCGRDYREKIVKTMG